METDSGPVLPSGIGIINDGISKELASLSYVRIDETVACIVELGCRAVMAKMESRHIEISQSIQRIASYSACTGRVECLWTELYLSVSDLPL